MGDHADDALDYLYAMDDYQQRFPDDDFDDPDWNPFTGRWSKFTPRPKTCKRCGKTGLYWHEYADGWRLQEGIEVDFGEGFETQLVRHECQLGIKQAFAQMKLDKDPSIAYIAFLDTIPGWTEKDF